MEREDREVGMMMHESFVWGVQNRFANSDSGLRMISLHLQHSRCFTGLILFVLIYFLTVRIFPFCGFQSLWDDARLNPNRDELTSTRSRLEQL